MCVAVPMQILELKGPRAAIGLAGNQLEADVTLIDAPAVGDWVLVHAGFAIEKLDPEEARETLAMFEQMEGLADAPEGA